MSLSRHGDWEEFDKKINVEYHLFSKENDIIENINLLPDRQHGHAGHNRTRSSPRCKGPEPEI